VAKAVNHNDSQALSLPADRVPCPGQGFVESDHRLVKRRSRLAKSRSARRLPRKELHTPATNQSGNCTHVCLQDSTIKVRKLQDFAQLAHQGSLNVLHSDTRCVCDDGAASRSRRASYPQLRRPVATQSIGVDPSLQAVEAQTLSLEPPFYAGRRSCELEYRELV
jgi:hypothetical protein